VEEPVALDEEAERLHEYAAGVAEAGIRKRAIIQGGQQDRHERNKRQDDGSRGAPQYQKGQQVYLRFPKGDFSVGRGCTKLQGEQRTSHQWSSGEDDGSRAQRFARCGQPDNALLQSG
jgi:hypothetical protein